MKSKPKEHKTDCEGCVFLRSKSCAVGRHEKFDSKNRLLKEGGAIKIKGVCNMRRDDEWVVDEQTVEAAREEVEPTFGVVCEFAGNLPHLSNTLRQLKGADYTKSKFNAVISSVDDKIVNSLVHETNVMLQEGITTHLVMHTGQALEFERDFNSFNIVSGQQYLIHIQPENNFGPHVFREIDRILNDEVAKVLMFEGVGWTCIPTTVANLQYKDYKSYKMMIKDVRKSSRQAKMYKAIRKESV